MTHDEVQQNDRLFAKQDVPVGPSADLAGEGDRQALIAFYRVALQQVTDVRHLSRPISSVRPLLKKVDDARDPRNFRPVSNLPFLSKLLERIVQKRLQSFLDAKALMPPRQSAYTVCFTALRPLL